MMGKPGKRTFSLKHGMMAASVFAAIGLAPLAANAQSWPTTEWVPVCSTLGQRDCDLDDHGVEVFLDQLREASTRFEALGFRAPALDTAGVSPDAYPFFLLAGGLITPSGQEMAGFYAVEERWLAVDYEEYFAMGTDTDGNMYAPSHELFHAIQFAYPGVFAFREPGHWVLEGSAVAAELTLSGSAAHRTGLPWLDTPLDRFRSSSPERYWPYVSYPFWLHLADTYGGGLPDGFGVLHDFLLGIESQTNNTSSIAVVDSALRRIDSEGLYNIYPDFIARYGADPQRYENVVKAPIYPTGRAALTAQFPGRVDPVSAQGFLVEVAGIVKQEGTRASEIEIRIESDDPDALHLIVGDTRYDASGSDRNVYIASIGGEAMNDLLTRENLFMRVVNVARDPADYRPLEFELKVTVYHEYIEVNGMGGWGNDHGPSNEAIDSPIAFPARLVYPAWGMGRVGGDQYCMLQLPLDDRGVQGGVLELYSNDVLAPGEYAIAALPAEEYLHPSSVRENLRDYPGIAIARFQLYSDMDSLVYRYPGRGGVLRIDSITPRWITGNAIIQLEVDRFMGDDQSGAYAGAPQAQPRYVELAVDFSASNRSYLGPLKPGVEFCTGA